MTCPGQARRHHRLGPGTRQGLRRQAPGRRGEGGARGLIRRSRSPFPPGQVCLSDLNPTTGEATLKELRAKFGEDRVAFIHCDVLKTADLVALYDGAEEHFGAKVQLAAARWRSVLAASPGGCLL